MRVLIVVGLVALGLAIPPGRAIAGGSWIGASRDYAAVGQTIAMHGRFGSGQQAGVREGPWYAYLRPNLGKAGSRVLLGPVDVHAAARGGWIASVSFTVPDVPGGRYWVDVCDLGCQ